MSIGSGQKDKKKWTNYQLDIISITLIQMLLNCCCADACA